MNEPKIKKLKFISVEDIVLRKKCKRISQSEIKTTELQVVIESMLDCFNEREKRKCDVPVGLAANQVGILKRIIMVDMAYGNNLGFRDVRAFINPEIIWHSQANANGR